MPYNKLRRELSAKINEPSSLYSLEKLHEWALSVRFVMMKALEALGGPVQDTRPAPVAAPVQPKPEAPEAPIDHFSWMDKMPPLPADEHPPECITYHGLELFLRLSIAVADGVSYWVRSSWGEGTCDVHHCLQGADDDKVKTYPHGDYNFCETHFRELTAIIAGELENEP